MELRFTAPELRCLDVFGTEVLLCSVFADERPVGGVAGLVDFRMCGKISNLCRGEFLLGELGEVTLVPGKPKLSFDKLLFFGAGGRQDFNERVFRFVIEKMLTTLESLRARRAVVELPGRSTGAIPPDRATEILLECAVGRTEHDLWTLVEPAEAERLVRKQLVQERRRTRSL